MRIVPDSEVAQRIVEMFGEKKVVMPSNVVTPSLRAELEKLGVPFKETNNQGKPIWNNDIQGNPINEEGELVLEEVASVDDITDTDFTAPYRNVKLPEIANNLADAIGLNGRDVIIKKNIFEKNRNNHKELSPSDSRKILNEVLWGTHLYGKNQPVSRPYNWIMIHLSDTNSTVLVEIDNKKDNAEIVNWHYLDNIALQQKIRQAEKEGGRILTLASAVGNTLNDLSSANKDTTSSPNNQISEAKLSLKSLDAPYLDAVARGDMAMAQRMVQEAAEHAGYLPDKSMNLIEMLNYCHSTNSR